MDFGSSPFLFHPKHGLLLYLDVSIWLKCLRIMTQNRALYHYLGINITVCIYLYSLVN